MSLILRPWQLSLVGLAGWINRQQMDVIVYLKEENQVLRAQMGKRRLRFTDDQRRRQRLRGLLNFYCRQAA